ncbi:hypothetical protein F4677DRAFT_413706 [Hypoxylon crocopeplum]|nr:hypothetical protein F4677DRAFT_413706 [Hypoxylon crocopeplum]
MPGIHHSFADTSEYTNYRCKISASARKPSKMPYLNPRDETKKSKAYFKENNRAIIQHFKARNGYICDVRCMVSTAPRPYLVVVFTEDCPYMLGTYDTEELGRELATVMLEYKTFPHLHLASLRLSNMFYWLAVKQSRYANHGYDTLISTYRAFSRGLEFED